MTKLLITALSSFLLSTSVWANSTVTAPMIENNSLSKAVLEIVEKDYQPKTAPQIETPSRPYTHESEKNNSLFHGALAKQGVNVNIRINSASEIDYSRQSSEERDHNSLFRAVLAK